MLYLFGEYRFPDPPGRIRVTFRPKVEHKKQYQVAASEPAIGNP